MFKHLVCRGRFPFIIGFLVTVLLGSFSANADSIARQWNELLLQAIRNDYARPTVHARNLFHCSVAMWDAWAAYDNDAYGFLNNEKLSASDIEQARHEAISYAAYRVLKVRFQTSPGAEDSLQRFDDLMIDLGYDIQFSDLDGKSPAALGNRIAAQVLSYGYKDGSNELNDFIGQDYKSANRFHPLIPELEGNTGLYEPNRWQPLAFDLFVDQAGNQLVGPPPFLGPHWGSVSPFALHERDAERFQRDGVEYKVFYDPGAPPLLGDVGDKEYHDGFMQVVEYSSQLDPTNGKLIDISPNSRGNNDLGTNNGAGYTLNPKSGQPYAPNIVLAGDYYRVIAEFWADGPDSETPPGHWFGIANSISEHPKLLKRIENKGSLVDDLEWDVKLYLALGGAVHDAAIAAWGIKGWYDYVRPISAIRYMAGWGQRDVDNNESYHPEGVSLVPGLIELITPESIVSGARHAHLAGPGNSNVGKIAAYTWLGPDAISDPVQDTAGVGWILLQNWWPYQRPNFVTPPFAGYISGHSTFSRAAAELLTAFTGDPYFPGGLGEYIAYKDQFLVFEKGPSKTIKLQWATYRDAADESAISRIYGGIHPRADDIPGRMIGERVGINAFEKAVQLFGN